MSDKEDTLKKDEKLVADDGSGVEIEYKGPKNKEGKYLVSVQKPGKSPVLKRMTSANMHDPRALDRAKEILKKESKDVTFKHGRFTVSPVPAAKKPAAKKSEGGKKRRKTKRRKRRRKRKKTRKKRKTRKGGKKTRRKRRKRKRRTRRRRR